MCPRRLPFRSGAREHLPDPPSQIRLFLRRMPLRRLVSCSFLIQNLKGLIKQNVQLAYAKRWTLIREAALPFYEHPDSIAIRIFVGRVACASSLRVFAPRESQAGGHFRPVERLAEEVRDRPAAKVSKNAHWSP